MINNLIYVDIKRWFANYNMPVIRYWNPNLKMSVQHSKSLDMEPKIILDFDGADNNENEQNVNRKQQILMAHNFAYDQLFEQVMKVEQGANADELQNSLRQRSQQQVAKEL